MNNDTWVHQSHSLEVVAAVDLDIELKQQIRHLHSRCFPSEDDPAGTLDDAFEQICFLHDPADCTWFLLWLPEEGGGAVPGNGGSRRLAGMCAGVQYHDSFYVFAFGVDPACRRQGYGKRIMFGIKVWVLERGLPLKISATVDAAHTRLIAFYQSLGASTESSGITSPNAPPPPSVRMAKHFDGAEARRELEAAEAEIRQSRARRQARRQQLVLAGHIAAAAVALLCVLVLVRRRRVGHAAKNSSGLGTV